MPTEYINKELLELDARDGVTPVTITVDGRELIIPRKDLISILSKAYLQADGELEKLRETPLKNFLDRGEVSEGNLQDATREIMEAHEWNREMRENASKLREFVSSGRIS